MAHKKSLEALDMTLRDLRKNDQLLGGSLLLLAGDFVKLFLPYRIRLRMMSSMLVLRHHYCESEGTFPIDSNGEMSFTEDFCAQVITVQELINKIYPGIAENYNNHDWLCERAILATKNDAVHELNSHIQEMIPGPVTEYRSIDTVVDSADAVNFPKEFLNSLDPPGMPPHRLQLKIGSVIIRLRNLDSSKLCNLTRLSVKRL
ncbi:hypothetical protein AVEN_35837-1 [Araneus ventricosus]|uniref:DNA helicase Pif1-like 2B domain-containing protein n=1 Tax=Araneus ventricosus TaxID=182803 RepID=A0A4Y2BKK5_ARAVE|nr:hypothetical protein AVEN_35837-1 [Araneus ventricosus]